MGGNVNKEIGEICARGELTESALGDCWMMKMQQMKIADKTGK